MPRAYPYGIYDLGHNAGFVNVGTDHDTGAFAVASIRGWWRAEGRRLYPGVQRLVITADGGGSNGWRLRLWKWELQHLADQMGLALTVCHFPPGTSKWNKVEHRLFSFISSNWRGEPLRDYETVVRLRDERRGQPPYDPSLMTKLLVYGYCVGVFSSRRIQKRLQEDVPFRVLARATSRTFVRFRTFEKTTWRHCKDCSSRCWRWPWKRVR